MFSGECLDYGEDTLLLEPKRRNICKNGASSYPCDKREFAATTTNDLKRHVKYNHEGVRYSEDKSVYIATEVRSLKQHLE